MGGVLIHCSAGRDRTGIVIALALSLCGVGRDQIAGDYALSKARIARGLEGMRQTAAVRDAARRNHSAPATMRALLEHLDAAHGGAHAYLADAGLGAEHADAIRRRLLSASAPARRGGSAPR